MKIICFDQSTKITGFSIWENNKLVDYGTLKYVEKNPFERMQQIHSDITKMILKTKPDFVYIEGVQFQKNYKVYGELSQLQGVMLSIFFIFNINFEIVPPVRWKAFCGVKGRKRKEQKENTIQIVKQNYCIDATEDEADAISIGTYARVI
jgi:Holliday junction resolvasome RuvABC endonuclease subunit